MSSKETNSEYIFRAAMPGAELTWVFRFPETRNFLRKWITAPLDPVPENVTRVTEQEFADWAGAGNPIDGFAEFCLLCQPTSEAMLPDACVFHAAAVRFRDRAWLVAAGSGVGKSTQVKTLCELYPDEVTVINGDKPILECRADGTVMVHPSPWNGKEGWHGAAAAPLGGIFSLCRGEENSIEPMTEREAAPFLYPMVFQSYATEKVIRQAGKLLESVLKSAPVWRMTNKGVPDSTRLMYDTMLREVTDHGV